MAEALPPNTRVRINLPGSIFHQRTGRIAEELGHGGDMVVKLDTPAYFSESGQEHTQIAESVANLVALNG